MRRPFFLFVSPHSCCLYDCLSQLISWCSIGLIRAVTIDNDLIGEPDIECMEHEIRVYIKTRKVFSGRIYAKGRAEDPECAKSDFAQLHTKKPRFDLSLGQCGMKSLRSMEPRGMYYGITLVVSFHPLFITKVDQAFHVKCFFEEANKGLTAELGVSMIPTTEVEARHGIPGCTYSIHRSTIEDLRQGKPAGTAVQFAKVGDKGMYGILLKNCYVTDGVKQRAEVIDSRGCPVDPVLITGVMYSDDLQRAYAESTVFKFADRPGVWFFCEVRMCMKKNGMCDGVTLVLQQCRVKKKEKGRSRLTSEEETEESTGNEGEEEENESRVKTENEITEDGDAEAQTSTDGEDEETPMEALSKRGRSGANRNSVTEAPETDDSNHYTSSTESEDDYTDTTAPYPPTTKQRQPKTGERSNGNRGKNDGRTRGNKRKQLEADNNENSIGNGRSSYGNGLPSPISSDEQSTAEKGPTVFGPGLSPDQDLAFGGDAQRKVLGQHDGSSVSLKPQRSEVVTTDFETNDDLQPQRNDKPTTTLPSGTKKDYVDYDSDVTIPPTLTDLLSNLPQDISADSIQKMFRDSVADRRALLNSFDILMSRLAKEEERNKQQQRQAAQQSTGKKNNTKRKVGDRIDTMEVSWDSHRMLRDEPLIPEDGVPRITGQLLIYDLDETPPNSLEKENEKTNKSSRFSCAISREGLIVMAMSMGSLVSTLLFVIGFMCFKQHGRPRPKPTGSLNKKTLSLYT
ncbi:Cutl-8 [Aphelenchoides besseyi]|nr:Cutl-8 [Aphelenchoides besseyi]